MPPVPPILNLYTGKNKGVAEPPRLAAPPVPVNAKSIQCNTIGTVPWINERWVGIARAVVLYHPGKKAGILSRRIFVAKVYKIGYYITLI